MRQRECKKAMIQYIIVFFMIFNKSLLLTLHDNPLMKYISIGISISVFIYSVYFFKKNDGRVGTNTVVFFLLILSVNLVNQLIFGAKVDSLLLLAITILTGFFLNFEIELQSFKNIFSNLMIFLAVVSLIGFFFPQFFTNLNLPVLTTASRGEEFSTLFFTNIPHFSWLANRNWGMFIEPGMYQIFLLLALMFVIENSSNRKVAIFILISTIISTKSTAGYINLVILLIAVLLLFRKGKNSKLIYLFGLLVIIAVAVRNQSFQTRVFTKLNEFSSESRFVTIAKGFEVFFLSPFLGVGISNVEQRIQVLNYGVKASVTNTWMYILVSQGIVVFTGLLYSAYISSKNLLLGFKGTLWKLLYVVLLFSSQNIASSILFYYLIFSGIANPKIITNSIKMEVNR